MCRMSYSSSETSGIASKGLQHQLMAGKPDTPYGQQQTCNDPWQTRNERSSVQGIMHDSGAAGIKL